MSELVMRLSPSPVCSSPAFIAIPSYTCLVPPILSSVAGSEHMDHGTLPSATLRPRIVCSDRYERHAAAQHTRCAHTAACTLALCPFPHDCSIVTCVIVHRSVPRPLRFVRATCIACSGLARKKMHVGASHKILMFHLLSICAPLLGLCVCPGQL